MNPTLFLTVFGLYVLAMIALSIRISRRQTTGEDFLLGNRSIPLLLSLGTTIATLVGTGSTIGAVRKGYENGWLGAAMGVGGGLGMLILAKCFSHVRRYNFMTMAEEVSFYYGANRWIKGLVAVSILLASIGWLGAHIIGGHYYLHYVGGIDPLWAKIILASCFSVYVIVGGYVAVVWTDTIQAIILFFGFILMAFYAVSHVGGLSELGNLAGEQLNFLRGEQLLSSISLVVAVAISILGVPSFRQRIYSADCVETVRKTFYITAILYFLFCFVPAIVGICANKIDPSLPNPDYAFFLMADTVLPVNIGLIVLIAGLSATMSSASSDAIAAVSILLRDIYVMITGRMPDRNRMVRNSRWGLIGITIAALAVTISEDDIIQYILTMISFVLSGLVVCTFMGKYWPRATWQGGMAAILSGSICTTVFEFIEPWKTFWGSASIPSVLSAVVAGVLVSLLTKPNTVTDEEALEMLAGERLAMEMHAEPSVDAEARHDGVG